MSELLGCPFCATPAKMNRDVDTDGVHYFVTCPKRGCYARQSIQSDPGEYVSEEHATRVWNHRAPAPAPGVGEAMVDAALLASDRTTTRLYHDTDPSTVRRAAMCSALTAALAGEAGTARAPCVHRWGPRNREESPSAVCEFCGTNAGGWYCPSSPNHLCDYSEYGYDRCKHCEQPEERQ